METPNLDALINDQNFDEYERDVACREELDYLKNAYANIEKDHISNLADQVRVLKTENEWLKTELVRFQILNKIAYEQVESLNKLNG